MIIILTGGSGCLGTELKKINPDIISPSHDEVNITNYYVLHAYIKKINPDIIIHAAAETDNRVVEKSPTKAISTNIIGSAYLSMICYEQGIRLVYLSTDYIYKGDRGNYKEIDEIMPFNLYSWTKLGGECSVLAVKNHLIIRTSFGKNTFDYIDAFIDKWSSKDYVDKIAPLIYEAALSPLTGVLNLGTERKTLFNYAIERNNSVNGVKVADTNYFTPIDTSLNLQKWIDYKSSKSIANPHTECRICGSKRLTKYLDLGLMPLANNLEFTAQRAKEKERFPLQVMFCEDCGLSQLSVVIDPEKMFSYYTYRSSVNAPYVKHCRDMANDLKVKYNLNSESFHIDIAGNDGALLKEFHNEIGHKVFNIDPATNLVAIAESQGIESIADFWSIELSEKIVNEKGKSDLITATNVFAHVDDVKEFIVAAKKGLKEDGVIILEFPYLIDFIEQVEFDTIYFEHLSYFSLLPINKLCEDNGLLITDVEKQEIHGGTIRVSIRHNLSYHVSKNVFKYLDMETSFGYNKIERYLEWNDMVKSTIKEFEQNILTLKKQGFKIAAFAASAKGNTLLNCSGMTTDMIKYIADETPEKIGKYSPGTGIPIVNKQMLIKDPPDYIVILSWNFKEVIIEKLRKIYSGKYIIPIPKFEIL